MGPIHARVQHVTQNLVTHALALLHTHSGIHTAPLHHKGSLFTLNLFTHTLALLLTHTLALLLTHTLALLHPPTTIWTCIPPDNITSHIARAVIMGTWIVENREYKVSHHNQFQLFNIF